MEHRFDVMLCSNLGNEILMRAISNVHAGRRFSTPGVEYQRCSSQCDFTKHFDPTISLSYLSLKLNNHNPEAGDVNTMNDEFIKACNDILDNHATYRYAYKKEQRSFNKTSLTKGILTSTAKNNTLYRK